MLQLMYVPSCSARTLNSSLHLAASDVITPPGGDESLSSHTTSADRRTTARHRETGSDVIVEQVEPRFDHSSTTDYFTPVKHSDVIEAGVNKSTAIKQRVFSILSVERGDEYKICSIVYKCVHGTAPSYLTEMCTAVAASTGRRHLRSAAHSDLLVPRTRTITYGPLGFAVSGLSIWNNLPPTLRVSPGTLRQFQDALKTIPVLFCVVCQ